MIGVINNYSIVFGEKKSCVHVIRLLIKGNLYFVEKDSVSD
jgi:hypothetical protein